MWRRPRSLTIARQIKALGWVSPSTSMFCVHASLPPPNTATHTQTFFFLIDRETLGLFGGPGKGARQQGPFWQRARVAKCVCGGVCGGGWWTPDECTSEMARARAAVVVAFMQVEKERLQYRTQGPGDP